MTYGADWFSVTAVHCIRKALGSTLDPNTGYPTSQVFSVPTSTRPDSTSIRYEY